jgi:hypothetical protein
MSCGNLCSLEQTAFSELSDGPVDSTEVLWRWIVDPTNIRKENVRWKSLLNRRELFEGYGLSVWRSQYTSRDEATSLAQKHLATEDKTFRGVVDVYTDEVRAQLQNNNRVFCIVDDTECNQHGDHHPAHAGIRVCCISTLDAEGKEQVFKDFLNAVSQEDRKHLWF